MKDETEVKSPQETIHYLKMNTSSPETKKDLAPTVEYKNVIKNLVINTFIILVGA